VWLRLVAAVAILVAAAVTAAVAVRSDGSSARGIVHFAQKSGDPDALGVKGEDTASVEAAPAATEEAQEAYEARAYPADEIPFDATLNAQAAWAAAKSKGKNKNAAGQWSLIGPSHADMPGLLVFSGADYTTSGRITALAMDPACSQSKCRVWVGAAGGGVWRTDNALSGSPSWTYVSGSFATNAIGTLTYDAATTTLYAGTGELNSAVDSEAGMGIYKSTDGGDTWTLVAAHTTTTVSGPYTGNAFLNRSITQIAIDPTNSSIIYVGSGSGVRGVSSVLSGGVGGPPGGTAFPLPTRGIYKSTDGGATFTNLNELGTGLPLPLRGATNIVIDPVDHNTLYAGQFGQGVYRSTDAGAHWSQIFAPVNPANPSVIERDSIAATALGNGNTRLYLGAGDNGTFSARLYRTDDARAAAVSWTNMTTSQNSGYCGSQCWYDNVVFTPAGQPDALYLGGSYDYSNAGTFAIDHNLAGRTNGRAFLFSTDGGGSFSDLTRDATSDSTPNGMHPDQHAIVVSPTNPTIVFFGSDGGLVRSSGSFADISYQCANRSLNAADLALCQQLLSRVPTQLYSLNKGLSTLQFQSLSVSPTDAKNLQGGTQDNGTWVTTGSSVVWNMEIWGDGGQSGFNAADPNLRFNTFTGQANDVNFRAGDPAYWVVATGAIVASPESSQFYPPVTADPNPASSGTIFQGSNSVWRTQDWGGNQAYLEANCPEFTTSSSNTNCGDFVRIGPAGATSLTANAGDYRGTTRSGGNVAAIERAPSDTGTVWAATTTGRLFVSKNGDAAAGSVVWQRIDNLSTAAPQRFISGISVDPANPNHAWISYSGYSVNTPTAPGHVFEVTYTPGATPTATFTRLDGAGTGFPEGPATDIVRDSNGDLYVSNDFGVLRLPNGTTAWEVAGSGLPQVEVAGLTIVPGKGKLYAATHGRSAWLLNLS
jgi:hypothetical protein